MRKLSVLVSIAFCLLSAVLSQGLATELVPERPLDSLLMLPTPSYRFRAPIPVPAEPRPAAELDSALAALAQMLIDSTHGESLPRLAVTPFEELDGSVGDTGVYMAEALEALLASSGRCRVVERDAVAQLLGVLAPTRAALMDTAARRNLVRVFRLSGIIAGTVAHMDGGLKVMARVVSPRTGLITRTGEVWVRPEARPWNTPPEPPPRVPPTYPPPPPGVIRLEGEDMKVLQVTGGTADRQASNQRWTGSWSGGAHLWWRNAKLGDRLELGFDMPATGTYEVKLQLTKAIDYGIEQCYLDGRKLGGPTDLYNGLTSDNNSHAVANTGPRDMGSHVLKQGQHKLEFRMVGINPKAVQSYMFGIDYLDLVRQQLPGSRTTDVGHGVTSAFPDTVVATVRTGGSPWGPALTLDGRYLYVPGFTSDSVYVVRTSDNTVVAAFPLAGRPTVAVPSPDGQFMYISNSRGGTVAKVRLSDNQVVHQTTVLSDPLEMAFVHNNEYLYVGIFRAGENHIAVLRTSDDSLLQYIQVGQDPWGIVATADGEHCYVSCGYSDAIYVLRTSDHTIEAIIPVDGRPRELALSQAEDLLYVVCETGKCVDVIRLADRTKVAAVPISGGPAALEMLPNGKYLYVSSADSGFVTIVRTADHRVAKTLNVGRAPERLAALPDGSAVYVGVASDGCVRIISCQ